MEIIKLSKHGFNHKKQLICQKTRIEVVAREVAEVEVATGEAAVVVEAFK